MNEYHDGKLSKLLMLVITNVILEAPAKVKVTEWHIIETAIIAI